MDAPGIDRVISRMAHQIAEANRGLENLALVGIRAGGVEITNRLHKRLCAIENLDIPVGMLDITLYRDDLTINDQPLLKSTEIEFDISGKTIVLVDDVIFTGRTIRAAMDALMDLGRPGRIEAAVLVDRGGRELPIQADFAGVHMDADSSVKVIVEMTEEHSDDRVIVEEGA